MYDLNNLIERVFKLDKYALLVKNGQVFASDSVEKHETQNSLIWLINPNELIFDIKKLEDVDNITNHTFNIKGMWACIIKNKMSGKVKGISSIHNEYPWYYSSKNPLVISNNIFLFSKASGMNLLDFASIASFLAIDCSVAGFTFLEDVKKNFGGDIIISDSKSISVHKANLKEWLGFDNSVKDKNLLLERFLQAVNESIDSSNTQITLTAGSDSRAVLAGILRSGKQFRIMTGSAPNVSRRDIMIPGKIADILGIEHIKVDASKKAGPYSVPAMLGEAALITSAEFMPTNWILYHKEFIQEINELKGITRLLGYGGEVFKSRNNPTVTYPTKLSFVKSGLLESVMDRVRLLHDEYENLSEINVDALYHLRGKFQFWEAVNSRTYSRQCHIYNPLSDPELYALAFRYMNSVENIQFHQLVYSTLPEILKKIPINFPKTIGLLYKFKRRYISSHPDYNYYLTPDFLRNELDYDFLGNVLSVQKTPDMIDGYEKRGLYGGLLHKMYAVSLFKKLIEL